MIRLGCDDIYTASLLVGFVDGALMKIRLSTQMVYLKPCPTQDLFRWD